MPGILVLGLGISGRAAAEFLLKKGHRVMGLDDRPTCFESLSDLTGKGLEVVSSPADLEWEAVELLVVSPGVPPSHPVYREALGRRIEVIGEAELAFQNLKQRAVAITGTNGKTTVTLLVEHIFNAAGVKALSLGNVGNPLTLYLLNPDPDAVLVVELSSYQLETMRSAAFDAGVILNITPDHLDRYPSMEAYAQTKCRLQQLMKPGSDGHFFVSEQVKREFSHCLGAGYQVYCSFGESIESILPLEYRERGGHDIENAMAAWALCRCFGVTREQFCEGLKTFQKPRHRIEFVADIGGVRFFDDSKGTNIDAVVHAVKAMKGPVILIAGGVDKGASYLPWKAAFADRVKRIIAIGQAAPKIYQELNPFFEMEIVDSLTTAVERSFSDAAEGDSVLLSPGCSSFDMFRDYAHRGEEFQKEVFSIKERRRKL